MLNKNLGNRIVRRSYSLRKTVRPGVFLLILLSLLSCIDEYWPETTSYENLLVVDGRITNGPGPFTVSLSISSRVNSPQIIPYSDCQVSVMDNSGESIEFSQVSPGVYRSAGNGEKGIVGRSYKISIQSPAGNYYESDFEELHSPATIDSVYPILESKTDPNYDYELSGYQFYVNTTSPGESTSYYLWRLEQTYEYNSDFFIHFLFDGNIHPFNPSDSLYTCWITESLHDIYVFGTSELSSPNLSNYPLNYVSTETRALSVRYCLLVKQYTLGEEAFRFWNEVYHQNAGETSLYAQQPFQVRGNIKNINDEQEPVLGYFTVAGQDVKRVFTNPPNSDLDFNYSTCKISDRDYDAYSYIWMTDHRTWPLYVYRDENGGRALTNQVCVDCREKGGNIQKPEFWIDSKP